MSKIKKFVLTYDEEYDEDIEKLLLSVPAGRRSERIRQLIRLGAEAEKNGVQHGTVRTPEPQTPAETKPKKTISRIQPPEM